MRHMLRTRARAVALVLLAACAPTPARAAEDPYTVGGVKVEATAVRPDLARAKAVADGELAAFDRLLQRLTLSTDRARLPKPAPDVIRAAIRNFSVESENGQGERYAATIAYRFDRDAVRALLDAAGVPYVDTPSPPIVLLPVWIEDGKPLLWDDPNPWREAWLRLEFGEGLVAFARLRAELADLKAISAEEAVKGDRAALNRIADGYKAGLVAVAVAGIEKGQRRITLQVYDLANGRVTGLGFFPAGADAAALDKAALQVARAIDSAWKKSAIDVEQNAVVLRVRAPISGLDHWIRIRQALQGMGQLRGLVTISMSPSEALVELRFAGTMAELRRQLEQKGFALAPEPAAAGGEQWVLTPSGPGIKETDLPPAPGAPADKGQKVDTPKKP